MDLKIKGLNINKNLPGYWHRILDISLEIFNSQAQAMSLEDAVSYAYALLDEFKTSGRVKSLLPLDALKLPHITGVIFYNLLAEQTELENGRIPSPVGKERDDSWMNHSAFCFLNVRAVGKEVKDTGNFIEATRILPMLRVGGLHLGPFFESVLGIIYAQQSFTTISDEVTNTEYERKGVSRYDQLRYFVDCSHLLGKCVGVDLTPHTCGNSKVAVSYPELFRWVRFAEDRNSLYNNETLDMQYRADRQKEMARQIKELCRPIMEGVGVNTLEDPDIPIELGRWIQAEAKKVLTENGYFSVVPHTWNGIGVPGLKGFHHEDGHPLWDYRDINGDDQELHSIGIHVSLMFHNNMRANRLPQQVSNKEEDWLPTDNNEVIEYLSEFFPKMHRMYGFDFLRVDYVDNIFGGVRYIDGKEIPICENLSPSQILRIAKKAKACFPAAGLIADHLGNDIQMFREAGFTLIVGPEVAQPLNENHVRDFFYSGPSIEKQNSPGDKGGTVLYAIDTQDMAHFLMWGSELAEREGTAGIQLRHFFSRFGTAGVGNRPKYETIGNQDMSVGIHRANNKTESLEWGCDRGMFAAYHTLEDVYDRLSKKLRKSGVGASFVYHNCCWWRLDSLEADVFWIAIAWIGEHNYHPGTEPIRFSVPLPDAYQGYHSALSITPILGLRPPAHTDESNEWLLSESQISLCQENDGINILYTEGTLWLIEVNK